MGTEGQKKKPDLGFIPQKLWLERRIKRICQAIADANDHHPEWYSELHELNSMYWSLIAKEAINE